MLHRMERRGRTTSLVGFFIGLALQQEGRDRNDARGPEVTKRGSDMSSDDNAAFFERCPVCRKPMQVVRLESGVPGLPPGVRRQMIRCSACELVAFHTFALEQEQ